MSFLSLRRKNKQPKATAQASMPGTSEIGDGGSGNGTPGSSSSSVVHQSGTQAVACPLFLCKPYVNSHLLKGNFKTIVVLPKYVDEGEWIALNTFEFYEYIKLFYNTLLEFCMPCQIMSAGPGIQYYWLNSAREKCSLPAPRYIEYLLTWINNKLTDEAAFPTRPPKISSDIQRGQNWVGKDAGFPPSLFTDCQSIFKQIFRVFAHIYYSHFVHIAHLGMEAHWNSFFAHFIMFSREFGLLTPNDVEPLKPLIDIFDEKGMSQGIKNAPS